MADAKGIFRERANEIDHLDPLTGRLDLDGLRDPIKLGRAATSIMRRIVSR